MISILIPIGDYPFFIRAILQNLQETISKIDYQVCFLLASPSKRMLLDIEDIKKKWDFKIALTNFDPGIRGVHLKLLDWAFANLSLSEWVYIQHSDMFWQSVGWLGSFLNEVNKGSKAVMPPYCPTTYSYIHKKFALDGQDLIRTHDFSGLYHRDSLHGLSFMWCQAGDSSVKEYLHRLTLTQSQRPVDKNYLLDGSDVIGLYYACTGLKVTEPSPLTFHHCWDLFGVSWAMRYEGDVLYIDRLFHKSLRGIESYSRISSFCFDYDKWADRVFPWAILCQIMPARKTPFYNFVERYGQSPSALKYKNIDIREVRFIDKTFQTKSNTSIILM